MISEKVLNVLACSRCKKGVKHKGQFLVCASCKLAYPVLGDVPDMLVKDAWNLKKAEKVKFKHHLHV